MVPWAIASGTCAMWQRRRGVTVAATATTVVMALLLFKSRVESHRALSFSVGGGSTKVSAVAASPRMTSLPSRSTYAASATAREMDTLAVGGVAWQVVGCAGLLLAAAARRLDGFPKSHRGQGRSTRKAFVVFSSEAETLSEAKAFPATMNSLDSEPLLAPQATPASAPQALLPAHVESPDLNHVLVRAVIPQATTRRVGQQRHGRNRHARRAFGQQSAESASRRRVGARLQQPTSSVVALSAPFDPSKLRAQIQVGLHASSQLRVACRRESRTVVFSAKIACRGLRGLVLLSRRRILE